MPNIVSQIKTPDNSVYDIKPTGNANINTDGVFYIKSESGSTTSNIKSSIKDASSNNLLTSYYEGLKVVLRYTLSNIGSTAVTLNINNLGAKTIKRTESTALQQGFKSGGVYHLVYDGTYFIMDGYVDTNTQAPTKYANPAFGEIDGTGPGSAPLFAASNIYPGSLVYYDSSLQGVVPIEYTCSNVPSILYDWGMAYCVSEFRTGEPIPPNELFQNINLPLKANALETVQDSSLAVPLFIMLDASNHAVGAGSINLNGYSYAPPFSNLAGYTAPKDSFNTFIYIGTCSGNSDGSGYEVHLDISNHDFITLARSTSIVPLNLGIQSSNSIAAINGRQVGGGSGNYNNPVSGAGANPAAAYNLARFDFVCYDVNVDGLVPLHCYWDGTLSVSGISYDWGLAFCNANVTQGSIPPEGTILQQITLTTTMSISGKPMPMYIFFDSDGMIIGNDQGNYPVFEGQAEPPKVYELTPITPDNKQLTQIYVGTWSGDKFHIDLSNHDFITYGEAVAPGSTPGVFGPINSSGPCIAYINGRPFKDPNASTGGATLDGQGYGLCNSYDQGGVTPRSGETPGSGGSGSGPWTALATTHNGYVPTPYSVVAIYTTVEFYPNAYLNINNTGAYPVYYAGSPLLTGVVEGDSMAVFMFQDGRYNLIAGGTNNNTLDPTLYERKANKVSSAVGLSSSSTDTQYPSAKCVYNIIGDIETLLAAI